MECGKPKLIYYFFLLHAFGFVVICWLVAALSWYTLHRSKLGSNDFSEYFRPEGQERGLLERAWNVLINERIKIGPMDFPFSVIMFSQVLSFSCSCVSFHFFSFFVWRVEKRNHGRKFYIIHYMFWTISAGPNRGKSLSLIGLWLA